jgi:hypothetical protein
MKADPMELGVEGLPMDRPNRAYAPEGIDVAAALRGMNPQDLSYLRGVEAGLQEWASPEDELAFTDL